jgi:tripartite-type tricarboxylate transporter receptor subunit TctC
MPHLPRRALLGAAILAPLARPAAAQGEWPSRPVRIIIPFPPGGSSDAQARPVFAQLQDRLGRPFVIDNRPGANGALGTAAAARAAPDGYTFIWVPAPTFALNPLIYARLDYREADFTPVTTFGTVHTILVVHPQVPARTLQELVALARANPGRLSFASPGAGSITHLLGEQFSRRIGVELIHVPFPGAAPSLNALIAGQVTMIFDSTASALVQARAGTVRMLAAVAPERLQLLPDLPTMAEQGMDGFDSTGFHALYAPAGTPEPIVRRLAAAVSEVLHTPEMTQRYHTIGALPTGGPPEETAARMERIKAYWAGVVRQLGIRPE